MKRLFHPRLADVPPDFRGISYHQYMLQRVTDQCAEYLKTLDPNPAHAPLSQKAISTKRDSYGKKSL